MKKFTILTLFVLFFAQIYSDSHWQKLSLKKAGSNDSISLNITRLLLLNDSLFAATYDGIWVSPSANGNDWVPYGLQGKKVLLVNFDILRLAMVEEVASDNATKTTQVIYKKIANDWQLSNYNPGKLSTQGFTKMAIAQIKDKNNNCVIAVPTWGNGIWVSSNGGDTWTQKPQQDVTLPSNNSTAKIFRNVLNISAFAGDTVLYGTDKAGNNDNYMIYSTDYGNTWQYKYVGSFFNPYAVYSRTYGGQKYVYFGGQNGNMGAIWRSGDMGDNWDASISTGEVYWECQKITASPNGKLYSLASITNVYVSTDNGDTFTPLATGLNIPQNRVSPGKTSYFFSDMLATDSKVYLSTIYQEGIYYVDLTPTAVNTVKASTLSLYTNAAQTELVVNAESGSDITIYSVTGKLLKSITAANAKTSINIQDLHSSVYIVKVISAKGELFTNRFVKK